MNKNNEFEFEELKDKGSTLSVHTGDPLAIKEMQKELNKWGYTDGRDKKLSEDGIFGINTFNSVIKYQEDNGLYPDGVVGDKTWKSMAGRKKKDDTFWFEEEKTKRNKIYDGANAEVSYIPEYKRNSPWEIPGDIKGIKNEGNNPAFPWDDFKPYPKNKEPDSSLYDGEKEDYMFSAKAPETEDLYFMNSGAGGLNPEASEIKESGVIKPGYNAKGEWSEDPDADDYGKDSVEYMMISKLDDMCESAEWQNKNNIESFANDFRKFDADSICRAYYLNDTDGASNMGHTGILLVNEYGEGFLFSYGAATQNFFYGDSRMNIGIYSPYEVLGILKGNETSVLSTEGFNSNEKYERWVYYDVSAEEGKNMFNTAVNATVDLEKYALFWNNCDQVVNEIFKSGGEHVTSTIWPNLTYEKERIQKYVKEFGQDMKRYSERLLKKLRGIWE